MNNIYDLVGLIIISPVISSSCIPSFNIFLENSILKSFPLLLSNTLNAIAFSASFLLDSTIKKVWLSFISSNHPSSFAFSIMTSKSSPKLQNTKYFPSFSRCLLSISFNPSAFSNCFFAFLNFFSNSCLTFSSSICSNLASIFFISSSNIYLDVIYIGNFRIPLATASDSFNS